MRDTGTGIDPEIMDRIFEPYYTTKEVGMGFSVIHCIMKGHRGTIHVESESGKGTHFDIYFPLLKEIVGQEKTLEGKIKGGTEKILFVDNEEFIVRLNHHRSKQLGLSGQKHHKTIEGPGMVQSRPGSV